MKKKRLAIFASGTGSNAVNIIKSFKELDTIDVGFVLSNKKEAKVLTSAKQLGVETLYFSNDEVSNGQFLVELCQQHEIDFILLAGYLRLIPKQLIQTYSEKIINLHPSLLPNYGGKGMFGSNVHNAVINNKEIESGITIHFVNQEFDKGKIIAQFKCAIHKNDGVPELEAKIRNLEQSYLPIVVEKTILNGY